MSNQITMSEAAQGLQRFFEVMKPGRITWGIIHRTPLTVIGLNRLSKIRTILEVNSKKAQHFLDTQSPNELETVMVMFFQENCDDFVHQVKEKEAEIREYLKETAGLAFRVSLYGGEEPDLEDDTGGEEIPF